NRIGDLVLTSAMPSRASLIAALSAIRNEGRGVLVYIRHPRKRLLTEQVKDIAAENRLRTVSAELRQTGIGAQILLSLGIRRLRLLTNSSRAIPGLSGFELEITERVRYAPMQADELNRELQRADKEA
ncbi:MAG: hypothetical protein KDD44_05910, partial [Bdellovibrionales bacterium]|nr:hypothetical protein [Bdellovibrionales bacterium]